jgi:hypothetical protein
MARRNMLTCVYISDDNKHYLKRQDSRYQGQLNGDTPPTPLFGSVPATLSEVETLPNSPDDLKPRRVLVRTTAGDFTGSINVFTPAAYIALPNGTAVTFYDGQGASHAGQVYGHEGEKSNHKTDVG